MSGQFDSFARDYHYPSAIPLAPPGRISSPGTRPYRSHLNPIRLPSALETGKQSPPVPSPYENPDGALFPFTPGPLEVSTGASQPLRRAPSVEVGSPTRPRRPSRPDQALLFDAPRPPPTGPLPELPEGRSPPTTTSPTTPFVSYRKPVPSFLPTPPRSDPLAVDFDASTTVRRMPSLDEASPQANSSRLSVGTFEALLDQDRERGGGGATPTIPGYSDETSRLGPRVAGLRAEEDRDRVVWSPRIHLGLDDRGVEAREDRMRHDQERSRLQRELESGRGDLGERTLRRSDDDGSERLDPHTPSPGRGRGKGKDADEFGPVKKRDIPFLSPRYHRTGGPNDDDDPEEVDQSGPVLRRGSKRLSDLADPSIMTPEAEQLEVPQAEPRGRRKSKASTLRKMSRKVRTTEPAAARSDKKPDRHRGGTEVEVVVHDTSSAGEDDASNKSASPIVVGRDGHDEGDWERTRREATCLAGRMNWSLIEFEGWFSRVVHLLYPFVMFAHIPATIFLDYNLLYILVQVALYPAFPSAASMNAVIGRRAVVPVPDLASSTGWWVAVGVYAACTAVWLFGICLVRECGRAYLRRWGGGGGRVQIEKVYDDSAAFNYACVRSFGTFSFVWQVRLATLRHSNPLSRAVEGTSRVDFIRETFYWYRQNWPTVLLLLPRAAISVAVLLIYSTTLYGTSTNTNEFASRDSAYFDAATGALTGFAFGVVFTNCLWAAWRLVLVLISWIGLWLLDDPLALFRRSKLDEAPSTQYLSSVRTGSSFGFEEKQFHLSTLPRLSFSTAPILNWKVRRQRRLRAAILVCLGSTPLSATSSTFPSPFLHSPYVVGTGSPWSQAKAAHKVKSRDVAIGSDGKGAEELDVRGDGAARPDDEVMSSPAPRSGLWGYVSPFVSPRATFTRSPLISVSRASPPVPVGFGEPAFAAPGARRPSGVSLGGDIGESKLHRRIRSIPVDQRDDAQWHSGAPTVSAHSQVASTVHVPRRPSTGPSHLSPDEQSPADAYPFHNSDTFPAHLAPPERPQLVSRFSAFSATPSSGVSSALTPSTLPTPAQLPFSPSRLDADLARIPSEHLRLSDKLLSELKRVESDDRRAATSDANRTSEYEDTASFATAREHPASSRGHADVSREDDEDPTMRFSRVSYISQPDSVGGRSETSTLRGAVRTPDISRSLGTFADISDMDDEDVAPNRASDRPLLPPFRLSADQNADVLSLGPATPVLDSEQAEDGAFPEAPRP
ncbi:hypothetical protein JCM10212_001401 [Sporobolomyces blumeae]